MVVQGFEALAVMAQSWENFLLEEVEQNDLSEKKASGQGAIARALSALLQQAWLTVPLVSFLLIVIFLCFKNCSVA